MWQFTQLIQNLWVCYKIWLSPFPILTFKLQIVEKWPSLECMICRACINLKILILNTFCRFLHWFYYYCCSSWVVSMLLHFNLKQWSNTDNKFIQLGLSSSASCKIVSDLHRHFNSNRIQHTSGLIWFGFMVFNSSFNNISVISWRSVLLVEETGIPWENHWLIESYWQTLSHKVVSSTPRNTQDSNAKLWR
jgi:hypothetical protein